MASKAPSHDEVIRILARQAARWSTAAQQDENPLIAALHANYGVAYALALRQVADDAAVKRVTGMDGQELEVEVVRIQDEAATKLAKACPAIIPGGRLVRLAREGG